MSLASTDPAPADVGAMQDALSSLWATLDAVPDPLHRLHLLRAAMLGVTSEVAHTVDECRELAVTWELIAEATGCNSKQAAQARYR